MHSCVNADTSYNVFAIVVDATYPHLAHNSERYTCTLKIVDMGQKVTKDGSVETSTLVIFGNKFEDCPIVQRVGDIIRVHRVTVSEYHGFKMLTAKVNFTSSWVLFSPLSPQKTNNSRGLGFISDEDTCHSDQDEAILTPKEFRPMAFSGKNHSPINLKEQNLIRELRIWLDKSTKSLQFLDTSKIT